MNAHGQRVRYLACNVLVNNALQDISLCVFMGGYPPDLCAARPLVHGITVLGIPVLGIRTKTMREILLRAIDGGTEAG